MNIGKELKKATKKVSKAVSGTTKAVVKAHVDAGKALQLDKAAKVALPVAAAYMTGPAGAAAVSQGGGMDFFGTVNDFLGGDSALSKIANSTISGLVGGKPKPVPVVESAMSTPIIMPGPQAAPMDWKMIGMIGGGGVALLLVVALIMKRK